MAVVCGMRGGGRIPPPSLISQPLMGLEGCFLVHCAFIQDLSKEKKTFEIAQKIRPRAEKMLQMYFLALFLLKICFYNFEVSFGYDGVKIGESVLFCIRIKKIKVNY